jgi:hypothetical protein
VLTLIVASQRHVAGGWPGDAPEIDGASISAGLGLVAACVLIVRNRADARSS